MPTPMNRIVGGVFGFEHSMGKTGAESARPPFAGNCLSYFLNARCAILTLCRRLKPETVWLPSYLCAAVLEPFQQLGVRIRFYDSGPNSFARNHDWVIEVKPMDVALVIHYFGFPNSGFPAAKLAARGAVIVEDASQSLFVRQQYPESSAIIFSPRKYFGVPDGGVLASSGPNDVHHEMLEAPPAEWWKIALAVTQMRSEFDAAGGENEWFALFRRVEETFPLGAYRSSDLARKLIESGTEYESMGRLRRENYSALMERLRKFALLPELDEQTVPLGFPVCVDSTQRDAILEALYQERIYPPIHWRLDGIVPECYSDSHSISKRILTLICDQRYTTCDMARQADVFLSAVR